MIEIVEIKLRSGELARISIWKSAFKTELAYFAKIIELKKINPKNNYGKIIRSNEKTIYYRDPIKFKADLVTFYSGTV